MNRPSENNRPVVVDANIILSCLSRSAFFRQCGEFSKLKNAANKLHLWMRNRGLTDGKGCPSCDRKIIMKGQLVLLTGFGEVLQSMAGRSDQRGLYEFKQFVNSITRPCDEVIVSYRMADQGDKKVILKIRDDSFSVVTT